MDNLETLEFCKLPVCNLLEHNFFIPNYQRGYRWEKQQVVDLLDDLKEFIDNTEGNSSNFYCLQPIVVKLCDTETLKAEQLNSTNDNNIWYEVIDGQQRLTTIYILLSYLENGFLKNDDTSILQESGKELFELEYETRKETRSFLKKIEESGSNDNIDCFYIWNAQQG